MADVNYTPSWADENSQCQRCKMYQEKDGKKACVPPDKNFEQALAEYGEASPMGHCDYFAAK